MVLAPGPASGSTSESLSHRHDAVALDGYRFKYRVLCVNRQDFPVVENTVCRSRLDADHF